MIQLPFNKWSLQFHSKELEDKYQEKQLELRFFCFRVFSISFTLICFLSLIVAIAQQQSQSQILLRSGLVIICIALVFMTKLLKKIIKSAFAFCFIISIFGTTYISLNAFLIPQFMYGFNTSSLAIFLLQNIDNRIKMVILLCLPFIQLACFSLFNLNNIQYIPFTITSAVMFGIVSYIHEYYQKLSFSLNDVLMNHRQHLHDYVDHALLTVSLNNMNFQLEFQNKKSEELYNISNSDQLKEFLRSSFLKNQTNLEHYLFKHFDEKNQQNLEIQSGGSVKKICVQQFYYGKPVLLIRILNDEKQDHNVNNVQNAKMDFLLHLAKKFQQLLKVMKQANKPQQDILFYQCISIMNYVKNQLVFLQQDIIQTLKQDFRIISLNNLLNSLMPFFIYFSLQQHKQFQLFNLNGLYLKINIHILTQILINIFEFVLGKSEVGSNFKNNKRKQFEPFKRKRKICSNNTQLFRIQQSTIVNIISIFIFYQVDCE